MNIALTTLAAIALISGIFLLCVFLAGNDFVPFGLWLDGEFGEWCLRTAGAAFVISVCGLIVVGSQKANQDELSRQAEIEHTLNERGYVVTSHFTSTGVQVSRADGTCHTSASFGPGRTVTVHPC